jgi:thiosulfate dehydrogenase [quinone] large subunit
MGSEIRTSALAKFVFADTKMAWLWLLVRVYVGWQWFHAGWEKLGNPVWTGDKAGVAINGFLTAALQKTSGAHPDVSVWYAWFINNVALPNTELLSYLVTFGEIAVGIALILGLFTGIAATFGAFMNFNYLFSGAVSINPLLLLLQFGIILAWRIAGWWGLDRWVITRLGVPGQPAIYFKNK